MRDGQGNKLSPEEQQKVRSIQGAPEKDSVSGISINPDADKNGEAREKPLKKPGDKPAAGVGE